ncbi:MAG: ABC transporter ATP-binding protein [Planctomyces sp.]|nr:ABC transporter ATP-binding protein [Planctomyces sp.]
MTVAIKIENVSKLYRLGTVGTGTLAHDLNRWWHMVRGKQDPYAKVGQVNDRSKSGSVKQGDGALPPAGSSMRKSSALKPEYVWALRDINLEVQQGEILGIIGKNGAGKSTLLKLLSRVTAPTEGTIKTKGRIASLLEVGTGFHPELTGRENIYMNGAILGMRRHEISKQLDEIVEFSGCAKYLDTPVKRYSSGMTVRLGFAVAAHLDCEVLIVDEVLAVGDWEFQNKCLAKMKAITTDRRRTVLFVTHNLASLRHLCSSAVIVDKGTIRHRGLPDELIEIHLRSLPSSGEQVNLNSLSGPLSSQVKIESISINSNPVCQQQVEVVDSTKLEFEAVLTAETSGVFDVGLAVSVRGVRLTTLIASETRITSGETRVIFRMPEAMLSAGVFQLGVGVSDPFNRSSWAWNENLFEVNILNNPPASHPLAKGLVHLPVSSS